jgi:hypothetical protein
MAERVLITGARAPAALDLARCLRAAGLEPHMADCVPVWSARLSNAPAAVHRHASPVRDPAGFAADIRALIQWLDPVLIVPACEEVFHLAALAEAAGFADRLLAPTPDILTTLHSKSRFAALCGRLSLPAPDTVEVVSRQALAAFAGSSADHVFKPVWSRFGSRTLIAPTPAALDAVIPTFDAPWVVQQRMRGEEISFHAVCHAGRLTAFAAYRCDWRLPGGVGYAFHPAPANEAAALRAMAETLAAFAGTGQLACDAIIDREGRPWLIECNPRATSGVHLFGRSAAFGEALMGRGVAGPTDGARHVAPALWRYGLPEAMKQDRLDDWMAQRRHGQDVLAAPGDPLPVVGAVIDAAAFGLRALTSGRSLTQAMTADIEWNGRPLDPAIRSRP